MNKTHRFITLLLLWICGTAQSFAQSAYLLAYSTAKNDHHNGLHLAWSKDGKQWSSIGPELSFLKCDFGPWGSEKKMYNPFILKGEDGLWHCFFAPNLTMGLTGHAASEDLIHWKRQSYLSGTDCYQKYHCPDIERTDLTLDNARWSDIRRQLSIAGNANRHNVTKVPVELIETLLQRAEDVKQKEALRAENSDTLLARGILSQTPIDASIVIETTQGKKISDRLFGIFFEDISFAADGGLYAEMIQNRDFEYSKKDNREWNNQTCWSLEKEDGATAEWYIDNLSPIHPNNSNYAVIKQDKGKKCVSLINKGFGGLCLKKGEKYNFSLFARSMTNSKANLSVQLSDRQGNICGAGIIRDISGEWKKYKVVLTATADVKNGQLAVVFKDRGSIALDLISLFPENTFKNRENGMRADLAHAIADLQPSFMRFPGGCLVHGDGVENIYHWKNTIGSLEARKPNPNIWRYHQTMGLGYYEYFQFCEDIGAEPVPVVAAGVCCQNSSGMGQQGIPMCEMSDYAQDILDLIEYANGDTTTRWGKWRKEAGHPEPFNLKYIGIGNEDIISDTFEERFTLLNRIVKEKHPEITVIGTVGPFCEGTDYEEGWEIARKLKLDIVDEHYYQTPGWFVNNQDFYDSYDRNGTKVYLGEYASFGNTLNNALAEAAYLTSLERNGDIVSMASYAPLLAWEEQTRWNPNLIYFNSGEIKPTVNYYVQKLYGQNAGNEYLKNTITVSDTTGAVVKRVSVSAVKESTNGDIIVKLVNNLPAPVKSTIQLKGVDLKTKNAVKTILTGKLSDRNCLPQVETIEIDNEFIYELPAYSFTVIRIPNK